MAYNGREKESFVHNIRVVLDSQYLRHLFGDISEIRLSKLRIPSQRFPKRPTT